MTIASWGTRRSSMPRPSRGRRLVAALTVGLLASSALAMLPGAGAAPAAAAPGNPGVPGEPPVLYSEDFDNASAGSIPRLSQYVGSKGQTYRADAPWLTNCNGWVASFNQPTDRPEQIADCQTRTQWNLVQQVGHAISQFRGGADPTSNFAVSAWTAGNPGADLVEFETASPIRLPNANGRFVTFSVDVAARSCGVSAPLLKFSIIAGGKTTPVGGAINGCEGGQTFVVPPLGDVVTPTDFQVKTVVSDGSIRLDGRAFSVRMVNANGAGDGNDHGFDNIRVLDVTPQLDKEFGDEEIILGQTTNLTFTITNTSELAAKEGWSFVDALPAGMVVAGAATTTCTRGAVTAPNGSTSITVAGDLTAGQQSCSATVPVRANAVGSYTNGPRNITPEGIDPPGSTTVVVVPQNPALTLDKVAGAPTDVNSSGLTDAGDTIPYTFTVSNSGNVPLTKIAVDDPRAGAVTCKATTLAVNASTTCKAKSVYTITAEDERAGAAVNTAIARGTGPDGTRVPSNEDSTSTPVGAPAAALTIDKTAGAPVDVNASGLADAGDTIQYSFTVTNSGNVPVSSVAVADAMAGAVTCTSTTLAVGAATTCTANSVYTITAADQTAGMVNNTATASGKDPNGGPVTSPPDSTSTPVTVPAPALTLDKVAGVPVDVNKSGITDAGDTIQYTFTLTNTGNAPLKAVGVKDSLAGPVTCEANTLAVRAATNCKADAVYTITAADAAAGAVNNTATGSGNDPNGNPIPDPPTDTTTTKVVPAAPALTLDKTAGTPVDVNTSGITDAGDTIQFSFRVTNSGNVPVSEIAVSDALAGAVSCDVTTLAVGASASCAATSVYTITAADQTAGAVNNTATATGEDPEGGPVASPPDTTSTPVTAPASGLTLDKVAGVPVDVNTSGITDAGDTIQYTFTLTNTGNVPVSAVGVKDSLAGPVTCEATTLAVKAATSCTADAVYTITAADAAAGAVNNTATGTGTDPGGDPVPTPPDTTTTTVVPSAPALALDKVAGTPVDVNTSGITDAGDTIQYTFTLTNTGNVPVSAVGVKDSLAGSVTCEATTLAVKAATSCTADAVYTITAADAAAGAVNNTATGTGTDPGGDPVPTPPDTTTTTVVPSAPALALDKVAGVPVDVNKSGITDAGDTIQYTFTLTNTGNVPVSAVGVKDSLAGPVTCEATMLAVKAATSCKADAVYTITAADAAAGAVNNTAVGTGNDPNGNPIPDPPTDTTTTKVVPSAPALTLDKVAGVPVDVDESGITDAGDTIQYSFVVTNTGNVPVSAVAVTDPLVGAVTCDVTTLVVGASAKCVADTVYTITEADEKAGTVDNTATAAGIDPDNKPVASPPDSTSTPVQTPDPKIELDKTAGVLVDANKDGKVTPGDTIEFSFLVTNTGNVTLNDIAITDEMLEGGVTCPKTTLLAAASMECTPVVYKITQADIDAGSVENIALVTGTPPSDPPVDDGDRTKTPTPGVGGLSLVKTAKLQDKDADGLGDAGEVVSYTFVITNTGTITVKDVRVDDPMLAKAGVAVRCEASSLAPGASTRCGADYTITKADTRSGAIRNVATAVGVPPTCDGECTPISSPPADATIPPDGKLAATGGVVAWSVVGIAVMFLLAGGVLIAVRRRRQAE